MTVSRHFFLLVDRLLPKMKKVLLDKEDLNSFRPITNLAFESNIIERIAACQVPHHFLVSNNLYPKLEPAFQYSVLCTRSPTIHPLHRTLGERNQVPRT